MIKWIDKQLNELPDNHSFNGIDICKFICTILVVMIHIKPSLIVSDSVYYYLRNTICRIAVPFFFVSTGFLFFRKMDFNSLDNNRLKDYCFKLFRLVGIWTFLLFLGGSGQLWYLGASAMSVCLIYFLLKNNIKPRNITILVLLLFVIGLLLDTYSYFFLEFMKKPFLVNFISWYKGLFVSSRNGLFFGMVFVWLGALFAKIKIKINYINAILGLISSMGLLIIEGYLLRKFAPIRSYDLLIFLLPTSFFLFYIVSHIVVKDSICYKKFRITGVLIYFTHLFVNYWILSAIRSIFNNFIIDLFPYQFILVLIFSIFVSIIIEKLSNTKRFSFLKYLYS